MCFFSISSVDEMRAGNGIKESRCIHEQTHWQERTNKTSSITLCFFMAVCASAPAAFLCVSVFATQERKKERKDGSFLRFTRGNAPCALKKKMGFAL